MNVEYHIKFDHFLSEIKQEIIQIKFSSEVKAAIMSHKSFELN
jgi:hypothetical protein